ncbi:hypothetical protein EBV26_21095 [bacterium]|nr:hypothetical protein [bacterium]
MIKILLVIFATALTFYLLRDKMKTHVNEKSNMQNQAILVFFLLVIYIGIFFWLDITSILFSQKTGGKSGEVTMQNKTNIEHNIVTSLREELDTGIVPF